MGGFCGFTCTNHDSITAMLEALAHRGQASNHINIGGITLGQRSPDQLLSTCGNYAIVFDGDIFNLHQLTANKEPLPEILLNLYHQYGPAMLTHLHGVFAFAIFDIAANRLFCTRDIFGAKPFYYTKTHDGIIFGSEIKSFLHHPGFTPSLNTEALAQYLSFQYSVLDETFFKGVYKLPPGHYMEWENGDLKLTPYHSLEFSPTKMQMEEAVERIDKTVLASVARHMQGGTEIGAFLSGGVDSGYVTAIFGGKKTFTIGFDYEKYNEIEHAKKLSEHIGATNFTKMISTDEYWESLPKIQYHMDEPIGDPAAVAFYFACMEAAQHVKIALSGEGADEFFGGYNIYKEPLSLRTYSKLPLIIRKWIASLAKRLPKGTKGRSFVIRGATPVQERFIGNAYIFTAQERDKLLKFKTSQTPADIVRPYYDKVKHLDDITKMQFIDIHFWLVGDILLQADKMSMAHGLQLRVPLLDREVFHVASQLPTKLRVTKKQSKVAFRNAAARHMPVETATRRKLGFPVPTRIWLRDKKYYNIVKEHFTSAAAQEYFHQGELMTLLDEHFNGKQDNSRKIWTIYMFLLWYNEFFGGIQP